jgi:DNA-binding transcriptional MerR regulator
MRFYSTAEVAGKVGVHKATLLRWLYAKAILEPKRYRNAGQDVRLWTQRDLDRVRRYKEENYCKGRGRKKAQKESGNR